MRDELYINNQRVDMSESGINLTFRSNLLSDISKIVSNYSYTIKLPKTANNMRIIGGAVLPSSESDFPYIVHSGRVLRDGIMIVDNANVVLLSIGEDIEVTLSWGASSNLTELVSGNAKLKDLPFSDDTDKVVTSVLPGSSPMMPFIDWGIEINESTWNAFNHPVLTLSTIFQRIKNKYGIEIAYPDSIEKIAGLCIPLTSQNVAEQNQTDEQRTFYVEKELTNNSQDITFIQLRNDGNQYCYIGDFEELQNIGIYANHIDIVCDMDLHLIVYQEITSPYGYVVPLLFMGNEYAGEILSEEVIDPYKTLFKIKYDIQILGVNLSIEPKIEQCLRFNLIKASTLVYTSSSDNSFINVNPYVEDLRNGAAFYFSANIPDLKLTDILKAIKNMYGLYVTTEPGKFIYHEYKEVYSKKTVAYDWSQKLISKVNVPNTTGYRLDDIAQSNLFKYKEDDTVKGNYDGVINVNDKTLDAEREAYTSIFAGTDEYGKPSDNSYARIPIYRYNDSGEVEYDDVEPRILYRQYNRTWRATFVGLGLETLISEYYGSYMDFITKAKIITETIKLSPVDLKNMDLYTPVYLKQYGAYFAILEIKTGDNNLCDVKLLKL